MRIRKTLAPYIVALVLFAHPALAAEPPTVWHNGYDQQPAASIRSAPAPLTLENLENADSLLQALAHRGAELAARTSPASATSDLSSRVPPRRGYVRALRAPLSSRMSGPAAHRTLGAAAPAENLAAYLGILGRTTPGGKISGRFHDWRSTSVYRRVPGRHNGYDVSLRAGSAVVVGWAGRVTAVEPWHGREFGVTVVSPDGFRTTYGHLSPAVRLGSWLEPGDVVGMVVNNHVDIKMRNAQGRPIDFAHGVPLARRQTIASREVASLPILEGGTPAVDSRLAEHSEQSPTLPALPGPEWTQRLDAVRAAITYVRLRHQEAYLGAGRSESPLAALPQLRHQLAESRAQLALQRVPEDVLLAAFLDAQSQTLATADTSETAANPLADWLRRQQLLIEARRAVPQLKTLLHDLEG